MTNAVHSIIGTAATAPSIAPSLPPVNGTAIVPIPPPPPLPAQPPIPSVIETNTNQAGQNFGRRSVRTPSSNDSASVGAHQIGQSFCSYLLLDSADHISRSTVIPVPPEDSQSSLTQQQMKEFMLSLNDKIGNHKQPSFNFDQPDGICYRLFVDDDPSDDDNVLPYGQEVIDASAKEIDEACLEAMDEHIGAKVIVPGHDNVTPILAEVKHRKRDDNGNPVGTKNDNPILDTRVYQLEFPDGRVDEYSLNLIAENMMA